MIRNPRKRIVFIVGSTAVGKTDVALALAKRMGAEIISCDSMQVYKGMNIITCKAPVSARKRIPHHMVNVVSPESPYNVSEYRKDAIRALEGVLKRKKTPFFVGGTGLYVSILLDGIFEEPPVKPEIRAALDAQLKKSGVGRLYKRLLRIDPAAAAKIHPNDARRIIRALEIYERTGTPISVLQKERKGLRDEYDVKVFWLNMPRLALRKRIAARVERMFEQGLEDEARRLLKKKLSLTASYAIGLPELRDYFKGVLSRQEAEQKIIYNTSMYAKRQQTWFRKLKPKTIISVKPGDTVKITAEKIWKKLS